MRRSIRSGVAAAGVALTLGSGLAAVAVTRATAQEAGAPPGAQVRAVRAKQACFSSMIRVIGFLVAREEAMVRLDVAGLRVAEVFAGEGDRVTSGQALVKLVRQESADPSIKDVTMKSPAAGIIVKSSAVVGSTTLNPFLTEPLFRIAVDGEIELEVEIPSTRVSELKPGQIARVGFDGSRELTGRVRLVPARVDERTQLGRARISLERDASLKIGAFARATIDASRSCGVSIPSSAVLYRTEGASVQVIDNGVVQTRLVQVGLHSDTDTEIREGVRENEVVVAYAGTSLHNGDKVMAVLADDSP